jgi:hypothetical protein
VARRRYGKPSPAISTAGQSERPRDPAGDQSLAQPIEPRTEYGKPPPSQQAAPEPEAKHEPSSLAQQIAAMRQQAQPDPVDQYIAFHFQGALPNERAWLRANPHNLQNPGLVHQAAAIPLSRGVPRHDPEFLRFIGQLLDQHHAAMHAAPAPAPAPPVPPLAPPPMPEPQHMTHIDLEKVESPEGEPDEAHAMMFSAPVSRGDGHSIEPEPTANSIRLSKADRERRGLCRQQAENDEAEKSESNSR